MAPDCETERGRWRAAARSVPGLPEGFLWREADPSPRRSGLRRARLAIAADCAAALDAVGFNLEGREQLAPSDLTGRSALLEIPGPTGRLLVRRYAHGGLLRWLTRARFADPDRPMRELRLAHALRASGFPTARVVAARARPATGWGWRLELVSERVEGARDLGTWLEALRERTIKTRERRSVARALGAMLARAHNLGLAHADLQPRNVLVVPRAGGWELLLIDLDRSELTARLNGTARHRNLARLFRAVVRREARGRPFLARADVMRVLASYRAALAADPGRAADVGTLHAEWNGVAHAHAAALRRHRLGWWLERRMGADPAARDGSARVRE